MLPRAEYLAALPRKRVSAAALIRDGAGRVLLVEPRYRDDWLMPGGMVEPNEPPARAAAREVHEELGIRLAIGRPLVMQWVRKEGDPDGALHFVYDGGVVAPSTVERFELPTDELASYRFVPFSGVRDLANTETTDRVAAALEALARGTMVELGR